MHTQQNYACCLWQQPRVQGCQPRSSKVRRWKDCHPKSVQTSLSKSQTPRRWLDTGLCSFPSITITATKHRSIASDLARTSRLFLWVQHILFGVLRSIRTWSIPAAVDLNRRLSAKNCLVVSSSSASCLGTFPRLPAYFFRLCVTQRNVQAHSRH